MIFLDLEGTLIDDLENRNLLQDNIKSIKVRMDYYFDCFRISEKNKHSGKRFGIFTFGWLEKKEIDFELIKIIENNLDMVLGYDSNENPMIIVKETVMNNLRAHGNFKCAKGISIYEKEMLFNEQFNKQQAFIEFVKNEWRGTQQILIDDQVERINITFPLSKTMIKMFNVNDLKKEQSIMG